MHKRQFHQLTTVLARTASSVCWATKGSPTLVESTSAAIVGFVPPLNMDAY